MGMCHMRNYFTSTDQLIQDRAESVLAAYGMPVRVRVEKGTIYIPIPVSRDIISQIEIATGWTKIVVEKEQSSA